MTDFQMIFFTYQSQTHLIMFLMKEHSEERISKHDDPMFRFNIPKMTIMIFQRWQRRTAHDTCRIW